MRKTRQSISSLSFLLLLAVVLCSSCSSKQIDSTVKFGNEGYIIGNGSTAILFTHGLSSSPSEEKELAEYLADKNITVYVLRLPGHGTNIEELSKTTKEEWYTAYKGAYLSLKESKEKVFVGGMSLGGVLALKLAEEEKVDGVISLAPALILNDKRSSYAWFFKYFTKYSSRNLSADVLPYNYNKFSVASVAESVDLANDVKKNLNKISSPIFLMQYSQDYRVKPESSQLVYDLVNSTEKELNWIEGDGHVMIRGVPNETVYFNEIYEFIANNTT